MSRAAVHSPSPSPGAPGVLLVDDNPDDLLFFQLAWEKAKLANPVRAVSTRKEAMAYLEGHGKFADRLNYPLPSLVLLDLRLPDGNGCELVRWIRAHAQCHRMVLIILSGSAREGDIDEAYRSGANSFLLKSASPRDLEQMVSLIQSYWLLHNRAPQLLPIQGKSDPAKS